MNTIRIRRRLESETLHLPELQALIGRYVEIIVTEVPGKRHVTPGTGDFASLPKLAEEIRAEFDFDAVKAQREYDLLHADDHLP